MSASTLVVGHFVEKDYSGGQGHCWRVVSAEDLPADVVTEIEGQIIDGHVEETADFVASNGQHYRW